MAKSKIKDPYKRFNDYLNKRKREFTEEQPLDVVKNMEIHQIEEDEHHIQPSGRKALREKHLWLRFSPPIEYEFKDKETKEIKIGKIQHIPIFTATSKMACPSFSLPPGTKGGSCPASALGEKEPDFICYGCYATSGKYHFFNVKAPQMIRLEWVRRMVKGKSKKFVDAMVTAIKQYNSKPRKARALKKGAGGIPQQQEYFRIHDSGDFFTKKYFHAWRKIADRLPDIMFWAPVRVWALPTGDWDKTLSENVPDNLIVRPSALYFNEEPPYVNGLAGGTSVCVEGRKKIGVYQCPAYSYEEKTCASAEGPDGDKPCRVCWDYPDMEVNYPPHADGKTYAKMTSGSGSTADVRENPLDDGTTLDDLWEEFEEEHIPEEDEDMFVSFVSAKGISVSDFSEEEWISFLHSLDFDYDTIAEILSNTAEWGF